MSAKKAGIIVIGNEVLSGKVEEQNAAFFIRELRREGVDIERISFIRDDIPTIVDEIQRLHPQVDYLFTTGGVGGTHDDLTMKAVATAFERSLVTHPKLLELLENHYQDKTNDAVRRMALVPEGTELVGEGITRYPLAKVEKLFIFPGVPSFVRYKFEAVRPLLEGTPVTLGEIYLNVGESVIADSLAQIDGGHPEVEIGSYPNFDEAFDHRVRITIESRISEEVSAVIKALKAAWQPEWVLRVSEPG